MSEDALPEHLRKALHWDWPGSKKYLWLGLKWVPRSWTSWKIGKPKLLWGNQKEERDGAPAPIGEPGSWQISRYPELRWPFNLLPCYFTLRLRGGRHFRAGIRWDDVDHYSAASVATRLYPTDARDSDTSTL